MMTWVSFALLDSSSACFPVRDFSVSWSHVHPSLSWSVLYPVVFIYPPSIDTSSCISSLFPIRNLPSLHTAITVAHTHSPFCSPSQGRHYNLNLIIMNSCPVL